MADMDKLMQFPKELEHGKKYTYTWGTNDDKVMVGLAADGYKTVLASDELAKAAFPEGDPRRSIDGKIKLGDAILMRCPTELAKEREVARKNRNRAHVRAIKEDFISQAETLGVKAYEDPTP